MTNTPKLFSGLTESESITFTPVKNLRDFIMQQHSCVLQNATPPQNYEDFIKQQKELARVNAERVKKAETLQKTLNLTPKQAKIRPQLSEMHPENFDEIIMYTARQNLACAFDCCADEDTAEDVENLAKILQNRIPQGKFVHIGLYEETNWDAIVLQNPQYASQYFVASLEDVPQSVEETQEIHKEFQRVYKQLLKNNAEK